MRRRSQDCEEAETLMAAVLFRRLSAFHRSIAGVCVFLSVLACGLTLYSVFYRTCVMYL